MYTILLKIRKGLQHFLKFHDFFLFFNDDFLKQNIDITTTENNMRKRFSIKKTIINHSSCLFRNRLNFAEYISF